MNIHPPLINALATTLGGTMRKHKSVNFRALIMKLGELQSVDNELRFNAETASPRTNILRFC